MTLREALRSIKYPQQLLLPFWNSDAEKEGYTGTVSIKTTRSEFKIGAVLQSTGFELPQRPKCEEKAPPGHIKDTSGAQ